MPKAYLVVTYRALKRPEALAAYAGLAIPALQAAGGRCRTLVDLTGS